MARLALLTALLVLLAGCGEARTEHASAPPPRDPLTLKVGDRGAYPPGSLRPGDKVLCTSAAVSAGALVPQPGEGVNAVADGVTSSASLDIESQVNGTVIVQCNE
jgi:hypothetical protein